MHSPGQQLGKGDCAGGGKGLLAVQKHQRRDLGMGTSRFEGHRGRATTYNPARKGRKPCIADHLHGGNNDNDNDTNNDENDNSNNDFSIIQYLL